MTNAITTYTAKFTEGQRIQTTSAEQAEEWARDGVEVTAVTTGFNNV